MTCRSSLRFFSSLLLACAVSLFGGCGGKDQAGQGNATKDGNAKSDGQPQQKGERTPATFLEKKSSTAKVETAIRWTERTSQAGVQFTYRNGGEAGELTMLETLGGGVALIDFDGDGQADVFATGGGTIGKDKKIGALPSGLFWNQGELKFVAVEEAAGVKNSRHYSHGAYSLDYDNDGFADLLITGYGGLQLFQNQGDGTFLETTMAAGLKDTSWSVAAAWGDVNKDGYLDLYIAHYLNWSFANHPFCRGRDESLVPTTQTRRDTCAPRIFKPLADTLYLSNGDGTFRDGTQECKINESGRGLGALMADLDGDGDLDIYVCNDTDPNFIWRNQGQGTFEELGLLSGAAHDDRGNADGSMGVDLGDYNLDGRLDLWVTNFQGERFALYENQGECRFIHVSGTRGMLTFPDVYVGWGTLFLDADNDADEDLFVTNGHVQQYPIDTTIAQQPLMLENIEGQRFVDATAATGSKFLAEQHEGRGLASGDLNQDGRLDLVISHVNKPLAILQNETKLTHHWIQLDLHGTRSSRDPIGARMVIQTDQRKQVRHVKSGVSFLSTPARAIHVGLNDGESIKMLEVSWPSGIVETFEVQIDRVNPLVEGSGVAVSK